MADKIIDLIGSSPPSSSSLRSQRIIRQYDISSRRVQSRRALRALSLNTNGFYFSQQIAPWIYRHLVALNCVLYRIAKRNRLHSNTHGDQVQASVTYVPVTELGTTPLYPHGSILNVAWIPIPDLFMMELIKNWKRQLMNIARNFMLNRTPPQVQSYTNSFFGHQPSTYPCRYVNMDQFYATALADEPISRNENLSATPNLFPTHMKPNEPQPTFPLFQEENYIVSTPPAEEVIGNTHGSQMQTGIDGTSMITSDEANLDLKLSLG